MSESFGDRCKAVRKTLKYGIKTWAKRVGFHASSISRWENGMDPPADYLAILTKFGVSGHWLLTGSGEMWGDGSANPTEQWLRRVGLAQVADASPMMADVVKLAESGGVSAVRLVKELGLTRDAAESVLSTAIASLPMKRVRGGRYALSGDSRLARSEMATTILGLVDHLPSVLTPAVNGSPSGIRFGRLKVPVGSGAEFWRRLVEPLESGSKDEPTVGEELHYAIVMTNQKELP